MSIKDPREAPVCEETDGSSNANPTLKRCGRPATECGRRETAGLFKCSSQVPGYSACATSPVYGIYVKYSFHHETPMAWLLR